MGQPDRFLEEYQRKHPGSADWHRRAAGYFAADGSTHFARVSAPTRPYITRAQGSRKWDVDGNEYVDYVMGHGALVLGHSHPAIVAAVQEQAARGIHFGDNHPLEVEWAERIRGLMPAAERVEYFASGMEANLMAIRLARVKTGRKRVLRFDHNYHGWADELVAPGTPGAVTDLVTVIPANDLAAVDRELASGRYAMVLVEGGGGRVAGRYSTKVEFYQGLPGIARAHDVVLVLDEVVTGFREAPGGWQSVVGITPDLTTVGKAVSGGLPCGALLGREEVFDPLSPATPAEGRVSHGGTWNGAPVTCAAGIVACGLYADGAPQRRARAAADLLRVEVNDRMRRRGVNLRLYGRSILHVYAGPLEREPSGDGYAPTDNVAHLANPEATKVYKRLDLQLVQRGVTTLRGEAFVVSAAHDDADLERTAAVFEESVAAMLDEGSLALD
jgi:glutamate-1-semialdehyde 2,1-aminomutase